MRLTICSHKRFILNVSLADIEAGINQTNDKIIAIAVPCITQKHNGSAEYSFLKHNGGSMNIKATGPLVKKDKARKNPKAIRLITFF